MPGSATRTSNGMESQNCSLSGVEERNLIILRSPSTVMHVCVCVLSCVRFPTLQCEAAADFEVVRGVVSPSLCSRACQCQKDSRLADELE